MTFTTCLSTPHPCASSLARASRVPSRFAAAPYGSIVGIVTEVGTDVPLQNAQAWLWRANTSSDHATKASADSLGGFAFDHVAPGTYVVRLLAMNHTWRHIGVAVRAAHVDTVHARLSYYECVGY